MSGKKSLHLFWGVVLILIGALLGLIVARAIFNLVRKLRGPSDPWLIGGLVLLSALCAFCVWMGTREFQRATGQEVRKPTLRWGRMLAGICMVHLLEVTHCAQFKRTKSRQPRGSDGDAHGYCVYGIDRVVVRSFVVQTAKA
jgi:hypothetical protein